MNKTIGEVHNDMIKRYGTKKNKFNHFPVGSRVKIITPCEDFTFFYGETGTVIKNSGEYLGIIVKFDEPRHFEDGYIQEEFNFNPQSLCILDSKMILKKRNKNNKELLQKEDNKRSARFYILDI